MSSLKALCSHAGFAAVCLAASMIIVPAQAAYEQQAAATKAFAEKAMAVYQAKGFDAAKADFLGSKDWFLGPDQFHLHVAGYTNAQMIWADTAFPDMVGQSLADLDDLDGVSVGKAVMDGLAKSPNGAAVQLRFSNPATKAIAHSEGYCVHADGTNVICAWSESD